MAAHINHTKLLLFGAVIFLVITGGKSVRFGHEADSNVQSVPPNVQGPHQPVPVVNPEERRNGKHLLDFVGLGTGRNVDPYVAQTNSHCLGGDLAECFKSQALNTFTEFFAKEEYPLSSNVRVIRMPETHLRSLDSEGYEYSEDTRSNDSEWDQLLKFGLRRVEKFLKSAAFEIQIPEEITEHGRYSPRFIDEISDEIDIIEDKKAPLFNKLRLKKMFIPLLIILKLFKLKLLLFLPFILGLASFKKLLGFAAIIIPGIIGYFKLCRPNGLNNNQYGSFAGQTYYNNAEYTPQYSSTGVGAASYNQHVHYEQPTYSRPPPSFSAPYNNFYSRANENQVQQPGGGQTGGVRFGNDISNQDLAYQGYTEYRNKNTTTISVA